VKRAVFGKTLAVVRKKALIADFCFAKVQNQRCHTAHALKKVRGGPNMLRVENTLMMEPE
jgi:hypothetical protein